MQTFIASHVTKGDGMMCRVFAVRGSSRGVLMMILAVGGFVAGCHPWQLPDNQGSPGVVVYQPNRDRVARQCATRRDTSAVVIPTKRNDDGSYASHYQSCL